MSLRMALAVATIVSVASANADIYSWKESSGRTAYGDHPPSGATQVRKLDKLSSPPTEPSSTTGQGRTFAEQELDFRKRRSADAESQAKADQEKANSEERKRACEQNRAQLKALESGQRVVRFNGNGEREVMDEQQRTAETATLRKALDAQCR